MPILEGVARGYPASGVTQYSVSSTGTLVFVPGPATVPQGGRSLAAFSMDGGIAPLSATFDQYEFARVSPDGKRIAVGANNGVEASIWVVTVDGSTDRRRLATGGRNRFPIWSPDGQRVAFQSDGQGDRGIFSQAADSGGASQRLTTAEANTEHIPSVWIDKGRTLLYEVVKGGRYSLWLADLSTRKQSVIIDAQSVAAMTPTLSHDGKWLAYHTRLPIGGSGSGGLRDNGGLRDTVWVRPYPLNADLLRDLIGGHQSSSVVARWRTAIAAHRRRRTAGCPGTDHWQRCQQSSGQPDRPWHSDGPARRAVANVRSASRRPYRQ